MLSQIIYPEPVERAIAQIERLLSGRETNGARWQQDYPISPRSLALLILQRDPSIWQKLRDDTAVSGKIEAIVEQAQQQLGEPVSAAIAQSRQQLAWEIEEQVLKEPTQNQRSVAEILHQLTVNPLTGFPILLLVLYFGVYKRSEEHTSELQ